MLLNYFRTAVKNVISMTTKSMWRIVLKLKIILVLPIYGVLNKCMNGEDLFWRYCTKTSPIIFIRLKEKFEELKRQLQILNNVLISHFDQKYFFLFPMSKLLKLIFFLNVLNLTLRPKIFSLEI